MNVIGFSHPDCARHNPVEGHPESPARLAAARTGLVEAGWPVVEEQRPASDAQILRVHHQAWWADLQASAPQPGEAAVSLDPDTAVDAHSLRAARLASGAACAGVDRLLAGEAGRVFCATRPPGHHAEAGRAMGFCTLNHVAVAAGHALAAGLERLVIADFDVHHGNGTQAIFADEPRVTFASSHQSPLYPGTGGADERGCGNIHNRPLPAGADGDILRAAWRDRLLPALAAAEPELVLVSAGFDAHAADPLAGLRLVEDDYAWIGRELAALADRYAGGRLLAVLEGGYDLEALRTSVAAFANALAGRY